MSKRDVGLYLPKFKVETTRDLKIMLGATGYWMPSVNGTNFSGMTKSISIMVSKILHKSYVEMTEEGMKAATDVVPTSSIYAFSLLRISLSTVRSRWSLSPLDAISLPLLLGKV